MSFKYVLPVILFCTPAAGYAATINVSMEAGPQQYESQHGLREDTSTRGWDLTGMLVEAKFSDGTSEQLTWLGDERAKIGGVYGTGFDLTSEWRGFTLSVSKTLTSLSMNARTGNAIFDASWSVDPVESTYGSKIGYPFYIVGDYDPAGTISAHYSEAFRVAGHDQAPDAYTHLLLDFTGLEGGGLSQGLEFRTDQDMLAVAGDISPVPAPASLMLLASGIGMLGAARKRFL